MMKRQRLRAREFGSALVEYALILALVAILSVMVFRLLGARAVTALDSVNSQMTSQSLPAIEPVNASP